MRKYRQKTPFVIVFCKFPEHTNNAMSLNTSPVALEDIAKRLGIAVSTVSRALRDLPGIHPATRAKVVREAEALGYISPRKRGNEQGVQPRSILTLTIGGEVSPDYLSGMSRASLALNFSLLSYSFSHAESRMILDPAHQPPALKMGLVAGIVLVYRWPEEVVQALCQKYPVASLIIHYPGQPVDLIGIDHLGGVFALASHLRDGGHRRIGFFGLCPDESWARSRFAAYVEALISLRLPFDMADVVRIEDSADVAHFPFQDDALFDRVADKIRGGVTAWICADDKMGYSLCAGLARRGLRVPDDVAVTGFHQRRPQTDLPLLTSTKVDEELLGQAALRRLAYRLDQPGETPRIILMPSQFVKGKTTR